MRIKKFTYCEYRIPFRSPIKTARGSLTTRRGFLVAAHGKNREVGVGEIAVLPEFGTESYQEANQKALHLAEHCRDLELPDSLSEYPEWHNQLNIDSDNYPAIVYGVSCAVHGLQRTLSQPYQSGASAIIEMTTPFQVNSIVTGDSIDELVQSARQRWEVGFSTLKLKVGVLSPEEEIRAIKMIRLSLPEAKLRLDANCGWTAEQAIEFCNAVKTVGIDYIEDPVGVWNLGELAEVRKHCSLQIAADEIFKSHRYLRHMTKWELFDVLILKPVRHGSPCQLESILSEASKRGIKTVFTTMFDTSLGLACTLSIMKDYADHTVAHGLDTSRLLTSDTLMHHLLPDHGRLHVLDSAALPSLLRESYRTALRLPV